MDQKTVNTYETLFVSDLTGGEEAAKATVEKFKGIIAANAQIENRYPAVMVVVDPRKEKNAVREARKLGVVSIALIDTDSDPDEVDLPIPGNDDSIRSIDLIVSYLADAVAEGVKELATRKFDAPAEEVAEDAAADEKAEADAE